MTAVEERNASAGSRFKQVRDSLDPYGIGESLWEVQQAWMQHPHELAERAGRLGFDLTSMHAQAYHRMLGQQLADSVPASGYDERFQEPIWFENPYFDLLKEYYLLYTRWLEDTIYATPGASEATRRKAGFWVRQFLNLASPTNAFWTNPFALWKFTASGGQSLADGMRNLMSDLKKGDVSMVGEDAFAVGRDLANTPGEVVFRNDLVELIQYQPTTDQVHAVPLVIIAPWINKYYILDLNERKSLVRFLVSKGFTVFITSWKNPTREMRDTSLDDYMLKGMLEVIEAAREISGAPQVHAVGYCIGGTMLAALMAWLNREKGRKGALPVADWTLFTTLVDFEDPGDIQVFVDERSVAYLTEKMNEQGYLDGSEMGWSFRMLRSNSLIWRYVVNNYLLGEEPPAFDVLYWNTDCTRLPAAMHSFYLREFYVRNKLIEPDALTLGGKPIDLRRITQPLYAVGTEQDHIAPWKGTFRICATVQGPVRYTLATFGHILGVVSPPVDPPKRRYWTGDATGQADPEQWRNGLDKVVGSWWDDWVQWLKPRCGELIPACRPGSAKHPPLEPAPGMYVLEK